MSNKQSRRLFFALWPDHSTQQKIFLSFKHSSLFQKTENPARHISGQRLGKIYKPENLHMTLHFLGNVSANDMQCVNQLASKITARAFSLELNRYGCFAEARIFWMGAYELPDALFYLHKELAKEIARCSLQVDARPYAPHITLMRNAPPVASTDNTESIFWKIEQFALVESLSTPQGVSYIPLKFYDLNID